METEETQRFELGAVSIDIRDRARRTAGWALVFCVVAWWPLVLFAGGLMGFLPLGAFAVWVITMLLPRLRSVGPVAGTVAIDASSLTLTVQPPGRARYQRRFARTQLTRGYRTDDEVQLETRRGEMLSLGIDSAATGEALLGALGLDARRRVLEVPLANIASRFPGGVTLAWIMLVCQSPSMVVIPFALLMMLSTSASPVMFAFASVETILLAATISVLRPRSAAIGMDGIVYRRFLRKRFYPYSGVASVVRGTSGVVVELRSGEPLHLRTRGFWSRSGPDATTEALLERIETARAAASGHDVRAKLPLLERRARSAAEWRAHLSTLVGAAGYRTGAVTARDLAAVIEDATLSAEHRVAATLALQAAEPAEARTRARIAAAACADKGLRVALDQAAEGELDEEHLARLTARGE